MGSRPNFDVRELEYQFRRGAGGESLAREFKTLQRKFLCTGMSLSPVDMLPDGKYPYLLNNRIYSIGQLQSRPGQVQQYGGVLTGGGNVHSIKKLNDNIAATSVRVIGAGGNLYVPEVALAAQDTGYSGNPLSMIVFEPDNSPQPWMYVSDSNKMRKVKSDGTNFQMGIAPPTTALSGVLGAPNISVLELFDAAGGWTVGGTAGAISVVTRVNTTITAIVYDTGNTGWAGMQPASMDQIGIGALLHINTGGGTVEDARVAATFKAVPNTTIDSIQYDTGNTGLCTIHGVAMVAGGSTTGTGGGGPIGDQSGGGGGGGGSRTDAGFSPNGGSMPGYTSSFWGWHSIKMLPLLFALLYLAYRNHALLSALSAILMGLPIMPFDGGIDNGTDGGSGGDPSGGGTGVDNTPINPLPTDPTPLGLMPDALLTLGGVSETVRVLSVTTGPDGTCSFRCSTANTHVPTDAITGIASVRAFFVNNHVAAETVKTSAFQSTVTAGTGWVQNISAYNLGMIGARATQPDDEIHISVFVDNLANFVQGQIIFDVDPSTHFSNNYFINTFRTNDLLAGIKQTSTWSQAAAQAYQNAVFDNALGYNVLVPAPPPESTSPDLVSSPVSSTGDSQWFEFRFKLSDLQRVGPDLSKGLADVTGIRIVLQTSNSAICRLDGMWLGGSFGPDVANGTPYNYRFRWRDTRTGARSNPSPPMRAGVSPHRESVSLTAATSADAQVNAIDYFRWGGALTNWLYVGTSTNASPSFTDVYAESDIASSDVLEFTNFQPFPSVDLPRRGVLNAAGTSLTSVSGDTFNTSWAPGTVINIAGKDYTLYTQPASATRAETVENCSTQANAVWFIKTPVLLAQALPVIFGPYLGAVFGMGDANQPGTLFWCNPNNPDCASDVNFVEVTPPSEPLMNGTMFDGRAVVGSTERWFAVIPSSNGVGFAPQELPVGHGLFARWGFVKDPNVDQWYFISKDGIYLSNGGAAVCITNDIEVLFPHDGQNGVTTNGIVPPDFTVPGNLRLSLCQGRLYFDFTDTGGNQGTLVYNIGLKGWESLDKYTQTVYLHYADEGRNNRSVVLGGHNGKVFLLTGTTDTGAVSVPYQVITPSYDGDDQRSRKVLGDGMLGYDSNGQTMTVSVETDWRTVTPATDTFARNGRGQDIVEVESGGLSEVFATTFGLNVFINSTNTIFLYEWEMSYCPKTSTTGFRSSDWTDEGYQGAKFFQGFILEADSQNAVKNFYIEESDSGTNIQAFAPTFARQSMQAFSFTNPFIAHKVRLVPSDATNWRIYTIRYIWEPSPELATTWKGQGTTHDLKGFQHVPFAYLALISTATVTLNINIDGVDYAYTVPSTAGAYRKIYLVLQPVKGKLFTYSLTSSAGFRVFERDCEIRAKQWNEAGPYGVANPFGDVSRLAGARI